MLIIAAIGTIKAQTIIYSEDMESTTGSTLPMSWTQTTLATDGGWKSGITAVTGGLNSAYFPIPAHTRYLATNDDVCNCNKSNDFLNSAPFSLSNSTYPQISFDLFFFHNSYDPSGTIFTESGTLEVSTNGGITWTVLSTLSGATVWHKVTADLTPYAGTTNVMLGFRYNDGGGWAFGMAIDNVVVFEPSIKEVAATNIIMQKYALTGHQPVQTVMTSHGGPTVATAILDYSVDGGIPVFQAFSPGIGYGGTYTASFTTPTDSLLAGVHKIKSWISDVNGTGMDTTFADDTAYWTLSVLPGIAPSHNILLEEYTGAACGYCPRSGIALTAMCNSNFTVIGASIHNGDAMSTQEGNVLCEMYPTGFPLGTIDRSYDTAANVASYTMDDSVWANYVSVRESEVVPATVTLSNVAFDSASRVVSATVNATFVGAVEGQYALNCYLVENRVYGPAGIYTMNQWNQYSYYYSTGTASGLPSLQHVGQITIPWSPSLAGLMPADYVDNHVVDKMMGGAFGDSTAVPTSLIPAGTALPPKTFTFLLPPSNPGGAHRFNPENIYVIGIVQEYNPAHNKQFNYILNVAEQKLTTAQETGLSGTVEPATSIAEIQSTEFGNVSIYPNPATTSTNVLLNLNDHENIVIDIYNSVGQVVFSQNNGELSSGEHLVTINTENFATGIYNLMVRTNKSIVSKKIVILK